MTGDVQISMAPATATCLECMLAHYDFLLLHCNLEIERLECISRFKRITYLLPAATASHSAVYLALQKERKKKELALWWHQENIAYWIEWIQCTRECGDCMWVSELAFSFFVTGLAVVAITADILSSTSYSTWGTVRWAIDS